MKNDLHIRKLKLSDNNIPINVRLPNKNARGFIVVNAKDKSKVTHTINQLLSVTPFRCIVQTNDIHIYVLLGNDGLHNYEMYICTGIIILKQCITIDERLRDLI